VARTILVVEDEPTLRETLAEALETDGFRVATAADGAAALELFRTRRTEIRAVVLDMVMPNMSGRATYEALRAIDPSVRVLLMSGHAMNEDVQAILDLGVKGFVANPYSVDELAQSLAGIL